VRLLLALSVLEDWEIEALDVKTAFLYGNAEDHINKALHIVCYVNTNLDSKIGYDGKQQEGFIAYADADWASDHIS
jgi:hypothetical protein